MAQPTTLLSLLAALVVRAVAVSAQAAVAQEQAAKETTAVRDLGILILPVVAVGQALQAAQAVAEPLVQVETAQRLR